MRSAASTAGRTRRAGGKIFVITATSLSENYDAYKYSLLSQFPEINVEIVQLPNFLKAEPPEFRVVAVELRNAFGFADIM